MLVFQVPDIGDYLIDVTVKGGKINVVDPNNGEVNLFSPQKDMKFIDLESGDSAETIISASGSISLLINGRFTFNKVKE